MKEQDIILKSLVDVDFSGIRMPGVVVYKNPSDYRNMVVARVFELSGPRPMNVVIVRESLLAVREDIQAAGFRAVIGRDKEDEEQVVETWMQRGDQDDI